MMLLSHNKNASDLLIKLFKEQMTMCFKTIPTELLKTCDLLERLRSHTVSCIAFTDSRVVATFMWKNGAQASVKNLAARMSFDLKDCRVVLADTKTLISITEFFDVEDDSDDQDSSQSSDSDTSTDENEPVFLT